MPRQKKVSENTAGDIPECVSFFSETYSEKEAVSPSFAVSAAKSLLPFQTSRSSCCPAEERKMDFFLGGEVSTFSQGRTLTNGPEKEKKCGWRIQKQQRKEATLR